VIRKIILKVLYLLSLLSKRPLSSRGEPGIRRGGSYTEDFEGYMKEGFTMGHFFARNSMKGTLREGSVTEEHDRYVK
jgi:hypothetical protein